MEHSDPEVGLLNGLEDKPDRLNTVGEHDHSRRIAALGIGRVNLLQVLQKLFGLLVLGADLDHLRRRAEKESQQPDQTSNKRACVRL
jgi:hypothetical protein